MNVEHPSQRSSAEPPRDGVPPHTHGGAIAMFTLSGIALFIASIADLVTYSTAGGIDTPTDPGVASVAETAIKIGWPISVALWWLGLGFTIWVAKRRPSWSTGLVALGVGFAVGIVQIATLAQAASTGS